MYVRTCVCVCYEPNYVYSFVISLIVQIGHVIGGT